MEHHGSLVKDKENYTEARNGMRRKKIEYAGTAEVAQEIRRLTVNSLRNEGTSSARNNCCMNTPGKSNWKMALQTVQGEMIY